MFAMTTTEKLQLPLIQAAQAQKHVTHNEALNVLDVLVHLSIADRDLSTPPASAEAGACYLVAPTASGDWTGQENKLAAYQNGGWIFYQPLKGWRAYLEDENEVLVFDGTDWQDATGKINTQNLEQVGDQCHRRYDKPAEPVQSGQPV
jgi:hypothetical protein